MLQAPDLPPVATAAEGANITAFVSNSRLVLEVTSERGFGSAQVTISPQYQSAQVEIRLHLAGLERFVLETENEVIVLSNATAGTGYRQTRSLIQEERSQEIEITAESPYWLQMERVPQSKKENVNARLATYIVLLPSQLELERPFTFSWIDFFR